MTVIPLSAPRLRRRSDQHAAPRAIWEDRWLLAAFRRLGHPAYERLDTSAASGWEALVGGGATPAEVLETVCALSRRESASVDAVGPMQARHLDAAIARRFEVVPLGLRNGRLLVATANPLRDNLEQDLEFTCGVGVTLVIAPPAAVRSALDRVYGPAGPAEGPVGDGPRLAWLLPKGLQPVSVAPMRGAAVDTLDDILTDAMDEGASDVHFEPRTDGLLVRFRIDGHLHEVVLLPGAVAGHLISRLKVMAGLDIADRLRPQDGRASMRFDGRSVDLRVSTLPLGGLGEKAVVRILDATGAISTFSGLGFSDGTSHRLKKLMTAQEGMLLVTGPTGSGKTTTLYTALKMLHDTGTNVVTVEDPIEYRLEGVNQVQVHERSGLTFAAALRSILRQDPDVVLVGEIRDAETASIATKAAMTGHVVLSTLHTNDAVSAVTRLMDIGTDVRALGAGLKGVVAQRLVRRLCGQCCHPIALTELPLAQQRLLTGKDCTNLRAPVGCDACRGTGYRGRTAVVEVLSVTPEVAAAIARQAGADEIQALARQAGMPGLWESGLEKVTAGVTSLHELLDSIAAPLEEVEEVAAQSEVDALLATLLPGRAPTVTEPAGDAPRSSGAASPRKPRVLIIDDVADDRRASRTALEADGYQVLEAADGAAGLRYIRRLQPDLVVTEIALPGCDGLSLVQEVSAGKDGPPVVVYSRQNDGELLAWARELGAAGALAKPAPLGQALGEVLRMA